MKRIVSKVLFAPLVALLALSVGTVAAPVVANAQEAPPTVYLSTPVTGMAVDKGKQVTISVDVNNSSQVGQFVNLQIVNAPEGWNPVLKDRGYVVSSVYARPQGLESVDLVFKVPDDAAAQDYQIALKGSGNGFDPSTLNLTLSVKDQATESTTTLVSQYPTLTGKSGGTFGFKADLANNSDGDLNYGLSYKAPDGWSVIFKPSYQDTQISSVQVKTGASQSLDITVTPPAQVAAGDYPITITASSPTDKASADLKVTITGSYQLSMDTRTQTWNTNATAGQESPFYVTVYNTGSAPLENVSLSSSKPQDWAVTFNPATIDSLAPGANREVAMMIKPSAKAIAGDYMLTVTASHPQVTLDRDVRVTVETPSFLGWVGVGVLVVVIGGLFGVFMKLGRR